MSHATAALVQAAGGGPGAAAGPSAPWRAGQPARHLGQVGPVVLAERPSNRRCSQRTTTPSAAHRLASPAQTGGLAYTSPQPTQTTTSPKYIGLRLSQ
jgi:hypothetical protein